MAIYRCEARIITRGKGHSAVAAAAYRTGSKIQDKRAGITHNYSSRQKGVVESVILRPENSPAWTAKTDTLWNEVERSEKRKDARLAREFILSLPKELSPKENSQLTVEWVQSNLVSKGMVVEVSLHNPKGGNNPHAHVQCTMRTIDGDKFSAKKPREWNDVEVLLDQRESWGKAVNAALEKAGRSERVDHRSLKDRGIDQIPQPKIGKEAMGLKKRGVVEDPERFKLVRWVKSLNFVRPWLKAIEKAGEVRQDGMGETWWERSLLTVAETGKAIGEAVKESVLDVWERMLNTSPPAPQPDVPPPTHGPELDIDR
jgi:ATP-dependent exoDNAse (exonuclease V) alpha subunit